MVLLAGNQDMVLPDLVARFLAAHDDIGSVFSKTFLPGSFWSSSTAGAAAGHA